MRPSETKGQEMLEVAKVVEQKVAVQFAFDCTDEDVHSAIHVDYCKNKVKKFCKELGLDFSLTIFAGYELGGYFIIRVIAVFDDVTMGERSNFIKEFHGVNGSRTKAFEQSSDFFVEINHSFVD